MAKSFVKSLGRSLAEEYGDNIEESNLREAFVQAIKNLPQGKLHDELNSKFNKYLQKLQRQLKGVDVSELPPLNRSVDENLEELTKSDLDGRKDVTEEVKKPKMVFCLFEKNVRKPNTKQIKKLTNRQRILTYRLFLNKVLDREDVQESVIEETIQDFMELCQLQNDDDTKSKFEWLPLCDTLLQLTTGLKPLATIRVLRTIFKAVQNDVNSCLAKGKAVRARRLASTLKKFMITSHIEVRGHVLEESETKQYCQLMSALLSFYVDLCAIHSSKVESKRQFGRDIAGFVGYILQPWPESQLELLLQLSCWDDESKFPVVRPLLNKCLEVKPWKNAYSYYLKYMLLMRQVKDSAGELDVVEQWNMQTKSISADSGFLEWLCDHCPVVTEHLPVEDKKFKKTRITRFLLEEAEDDLISLLLDSFGTEDDGSNIAAEKTIFDVMAPEELFYLDKGGDNNSEDQPQDADSNDQSADDSFTIIKTLSDMEKLIEDATRLPENKGQTYKLDKRLAKRVTKDPDTQKFLQSGIVSITKLEAEKENEEEMEIDDNDVETTQASTTINDSMSSSLKSEGSGKKKRRERKKKNKSSSSSTPDRNKSKPNDTGKELQIADSDISVIEVSNGTFVSEPTMSDDNETIKSVVRKVSPKKKADKKQNDTMSSAITIDGSETTDISNVDVRDSSSIVDSSEDETTDKYDAVDGSGSNGVSGSVSLFDSQDSSTGHGSTTVTTDEITCLVGDSDDDVYGSMDETVKFVGKPSGSRTESVEKKQKSPRKQSENKNNEKNQTIDNEIDSITSYDTTSKLSEIYGDVESDTSVFMSSPKSNTSKANGKTPTRSMQEKFIVKATLSRSAKKPQKLGISPKKGDEATETKDAPRTKSTEEIISIVEEIKEKIQTPRTRRSTNKLNQNDSMFTDDSIESADKSRSSIDSGSPEKALKASANTDSRKSIVVDSSSDEENKPKLSTATPKSASKTGDHKQTAEPGELLKSPAANEKDRKESVAMDSCSEADFANEASEGIVISDSDSETDIPKVNDKQSGLHGDKSEEQDIDIVDGQIEKSPQKKTTTPAKVVEQTPEKKTPKSAKKLEESQEISTPDLGIEVYTPKQKTPKSAKKTETQSGNKTPVSDKNTDDDEVIKEIDRTPNSAKQFDSMAGRQTYSTGKRITTPKSASKSIGNSLRKKSMGDQKNTPDKKEISFTIETERQSDSDFESEEVLPKRKANSISELDKQTLSPAKKELKTPKSAKEQSESDLKTPRSAKKMSSQKTPNSAEEQSDSDFKTLSSAKKTSSQKTPKSARKQSNSDLKSPSSATKMARQKTPKSGKKSQNLDKTQEGQYDANYLSPAAALYDSKKLNSPPPRKLDDSTDDVVPSSCKKLAAGQDSESDIAAVPDIAIHLKSDAAEIGVDSPKVPRVAKNMPAEMIEDEKSPEKPKRTTRRSSIMKKDLTDSESSPPKPTRQLRTRTVSECSSDVGPSEPKKPRAASARKAKKPSDVLSSVPEAVLEEPTQTTPRAGTKPRTLSASTSKKLVTKVEQLKGTRKRRLSGEFSDSQNGNMSSDSEVSFPNRKKSAATTATKRNSKRVSAPPAPLDQAPSDTDDTGRRYTLRKR